MKVLILIAHPRPDSFCHALARLAYEVAASAGWDVLFHDLYSEGFDPVLKPQEARTHGASVNEILAVTEDPMPAAHRVDMTAADVLIIVHPNWWGMPPAILAGWVDRVLIAGVAYKLETGEGLPQGLLGLKAALVLNTSDTPAEREDAVSGDPLDLIWRRCILPFCGMPRIDRKVYRPVAAAALSERVAWLDDASKRVTETLKAALGTDRL